MFKPRPLVDLAAAVSSALLMNEFQWMGIIVKPINYSLKGAILYIDTGPGLRIEESHAIEMEWSANASQNADVDNLGSSRSEGYAVAEQSKQLTLQNGKLELPEWASNITSVLWIPVQAISDGLARGTSAGEYSDKLLVFVLCIFMQCVIFLLCFNFLTLRDAFF